MHRFFALALILAVGAGAVALPHTARADGAVPLEVAIGAENVRLLTQTFAALSQVLANLNAYVATHPNMSAAERLSIANVLAGLAQSLASIARTIAALDAQAQASLTTPQVSQTPPETATTTEPAPVIATTEEPPASQTASLGETGPKGWVLPAVFVGILAVAMVYLLWRGSRRRRQVLAYPVPARGARGGPPEPVLSRSDEPSPPSSSSEEPGTNTPSP